MNPSLTPPTHSPSSLQAKQEEEAVRKSKEDVRKSMDVGAAAIKAAAAKTGSYGTLTLVKQNNAFK